MENILYKNKEALDKTMEAIKKAGTDSIHILADFDRTLSKGRVEGVKSPTVIAQIRNGNYLSPEYAAQAHALFDEYYPIEVDPNIPRDEKVAKMHEWWSRHFTLLIESGLDKDVMKDIISKQTLQFREGAFDLLDLSNKLDIPFVIMSAGPGDMIIEYLEYADRLLPNVEIVANLFEFDETGTVTKIKEPIIHSLNKYETAIQGFPAYDKIKDRKNVILIGDGADDIGMVTGFDYDNIISIGFLNALSTDENYEVTLQKFKDTFDIVVLNDGPMDFIVELLQDLTS